MKTQLFNARYENKSKHFLKISGASFRHSESGINKGCEVGFYQDLF